MNNAERAEQRYY